MTSLSVESDLNLFSCYIFLNGLKDCVYFVNTI